MCGIAGQYRFGSLGASLAGLEKVNLRQSARGPDNSGAFAAGGMALGHRRLKIFDLSERAAQPMVDHQLGLAITFNGAIYNFRQLRGELEAKGYRFVSQSDTEVLLKAYHAWGKGCIARLSGMFAFAIWERDSGKLVLARDRMGIKPIYYARTRDGFQFASALPALLEFDCIDTSIDPVALHYYLTFHAVPEPLTILSGVRKIPPGAIVTVHPDGGCEEETYWQLRIDDRQADHKRNRDDWVAATQEALTVATNRQLSADVPIGVLLSGGLDSSLLVALAAQTRGSDINTFSIGFEGARGEKGDEFFYSDLIAKRFGTRHYQMFISNGGLEESLADCVAAMSEPMVSHDNIGFFLLSREVAKHVKVVLSGQGADEVFAGYHWFQALGNGANSVAQLASNILSKVADRTFDDYQRLVTPEFRTSEHSRTFLEALCAENGSASLADNLLVYESTFALANGPLGRVDNMTMASGLEARVPFLDEAVVSLAAEMPLGAKLDDGGKGVLKRLGRKLLPDEIVDRPKGYFPVPALKYLQGGTLQLLRQALSPENIRRRGVFNPAEVQPMLDNPADYLTPTGGSKLWQIGLLEYWLQCQGL
jgi:asparagine synthase (glutamine-hydrolysing)